MYKGTTWKWWIIGLIALTIACATDDVENGDADDDVELEVFSDDSLSWQLGVGETDTEQFKISNAAGGVLEFAIDHDADWLVIDPSSGEVEGGDFVDIEARATCPDTEGEFETTLEITSNAASSESLEIDALLECVDSDELLPPGSLEIVVAGLPQGVDSDITIAGPDDFSEAVSETVIFEDLADGTYEISAQPVGDDPVFEPQPSQSTVDVAAGDEVAVTIAYSEEQDKTGVGSVQVHVEGLPDGVEPNLTLKADFDQWDIPADGRVDELQPSTYTVIADSVEHEGTVYEASDVDVEVVVDEVAEVTVTYLADAGYLEIEVLGLPAGVEHAIDVIADADGEVATVPQSGSLTLKAGIYEVTPRDVTEGLVTFEAPSMAVEIADGETESATVVYEPIPARLPVVVDGLPAGVNAAVELVGEDEVESVTGSETIEDLPPGIYEVIVDDVVDGSTTYIGSGPSQVSVESGENDALEIAYSEEAAGGELIIEIAGDLDSGEADVDITGPEFDESTTSNQTYSGLLAGEYDVVANDVIDGDIEYEGTGATVTVESGQSTTVSVVYEVVRGDLPITITGLPADVDADVDVVGDNQSENLSETGTVSGLFPGSYNIIPNDVDDGTSSYGASMMTVDVISGVNDPIAIEYEAATTSINIVVAGDLGGNDADIEITGPAGFEETVTQSQTFSELEPGEYSVVVHDVEDETSSQVYAGSGSQDLTLNLGETATVTAEYELLASDIVVTVDEVGDVDYQISMTGPDSFEETIEGDASFSDVAPGDYTLSVDDTSQDEFGNDHVITIDPADFELQAGETQSVDIQVAPAHLVTTEDDGPSVPGSLRYVIDDVVESTIVRFAEHVSEITLHEGQIAIDKELTIRDDQDGPVVIRGAEDRIFHIQSGTDLYVEDIVLRDGEADGGGAVRVEGGAGLWAERVIFEDNYSSTYGGAVLLEEGGWFQGTEVIMEANIAEQWGAAIESPSASTEASGVRLRASLIRDNISHQSGGAVDIGGDATLEVEHVTFTGNQSDGFGAAITLFSGQAHIEGATITDNTSLSGAVTGGIYIRSEGDLQLRGSIVAGNQQLDVDGDPNGFTSLGYNVIGAAGDGFFDDPDKGDQVGTTADPLAPELEPLAYNGGFAETMALGAGSPARSVMVGDQCVENANLDWSIDQRGEYRPAGAYCSAGAVELDTTVETFENADMGTDAYYDGSFDGVAGIQWQYEDVRLSTNDSTDTNNHETSFDTNSVILRDGSKLSAAGIPGGISSLSMKVSQAFGNTNERRMEAFINGNSVGVSQEIQTEGSEPYPIYIFAIEDIDVDGDFDIEIRPVEDSTQIAVDDISWR